jgi:hypothetical protein
MRFVRDLFVAVALLALPLAGHAGGSYTFETNSLDDLAHGTAYTWGLTGSTLTDLETQLKDNKNDTITKVTLTLTGISDWTSEPDDVLYVDILNGLESGVNSTTYNSNPNQDDNSGYTVASQSDPFETSTSNNGLLNGVAGHVTYDAPTTYTSALIAPGTKSSSGNPGTYTSTGSPAWTNPTGDPGTFSADDTTSSFTVTYTLSTANVTLLDSLLDPSEGSASTDLGLGFGPDCHFYDTGVTLTVYTSVPDEGTTLVMFAAALVGLLGFKRLLQRPVLA